MKQRGSNVKVICSSAIYIYTTVKYSVKEKERN